MFNASDIQALQNFDLGQVTCWLGIWVAFLVSLMRLMLVVTAECNPHHR